MRKWNVNWRSSLNKRTIVLVGILIGQMAISYALSVTERALGTPELRMLPTRLTGWVLAEEQSLEPNIEAYLRPDDYIVRQYISDSRSSSINLFVAYFKSLQNSYGPHSPRVCLPGSGWMTRSWKIVNIEMPGRRERIPVNEYLLEKDGSSILVLYWYQNRHRIWAEEFQAKIHLLPDLIRYRRSDVSLVRLVMPVAEPSALTGVLKQSIEFSRELYPFLKERLESIN